MTVIWTKNCGSPEGQRTEGETRVSQSIWRYCSETMKKTCGAKDFSKSTNRRKVWTRRGTSKGPKMFRAPAHRREWSSATNSKYPNCRLKRVWLCCKKSYTPYPSESHIRKTKSHERRSRGKSQEIRIQFRSGFENFNPQNFGCSENVSIDDKFTI